MRDQPTPEQTPERIAEILSALACTDWTQVVLNQGPPCFHYEADNSRFCLRAKRWAGHTDKDEWPEHRYVPLHELFKTELDALTATLAHLTQELEQSRAETVAADALSEQKMRETDAFWQQMLEQKRRAEQAEATLARVKAQRDELRTALVKVRAHTSYVNPTDELLRGLLQSIERIADAALVDPPVSSSTEQTTTPENRPEQD